MGTCVLSLSGRLAVMACLQLFQKSTGLGLSEGQGGAWPRHPLYPVQCLARREEKPHEVLHWMDV